MNNLPIQNIKTFDFFGGFFYYFEEYLGNDFKP